MLSTGKTVAVRATTPTGTTNTSPERTYSQMLAGAASSPSGEAWASMMAKKMSTLTAPT
jgi:hypothetical protein